MTPNSINYSERAPELPYVADHGEAGRTAAFAWSARHKERRLRERAAWHQQRATDQRAEDRAAGITWWDRIVLNMLEDGYTVHPAIARMSKVQIPVAAAVIENESAATPVKSAQPAGKVEFVDPTHWEGKPVPHRRWHTADLIPSRTVTMLSGDGGLGKSLLSLQISIASALGESTVGLDPSPCRVLYVGAEDEVDEFHRRIDSILTSMGRPFADLDGKFLLVPLAEQDATLAMPDKGGKMQPTDLMHTLCKKIDEFAPGLIVLDTSADLFGGDEIKRTQVRQFVAMLRTMAISADAAVLLLSHPSVAGMQSGSGTSGSTAWNNSVRSRLYLTAPSGDDADPDARTLTNKKANYGRKGDALELRWHEGVFVRDDGSTPNMAAGFLHKADDELFVELLRKLCKFGQTPSPKPCQTYAPKLMLGLPEGREVGKKRFEAAMRRLLESGTIEIVEDGPPSKKRSHLIVAADNFGASS